MEAQQTREEQISGFDPDGVGRKGRLFGLPFTPETARVVIIPVPWEVTVSYRAGTARGPRAVLEASSQIDYHLPGIPEAWKTGVAMEPIPEIWAQRSAELRKRVEPYLAWLEAGNTVEGAPSEYADLIAEVDAAGQELASWLAGRATAHLEAGRLVGVLGGDHSTPLGLIEALTRHHGDFGILQIDAHADLRPAYEGFRYSHASIMTNALELPQVCRLVQVGVRDLSGQEARTIKESRGRIVCHHAMELLAARYEGETWAEQCKRIVSQLPGRIYISFDIDGLNPALCPHTGTPVPCGLAMEEALYLIGLALRSGREIIGFDLCEVAPGDGDWDGNVGARILYHLATMAGNETAE